MREVAATRPLDYDGDSHNLIQQLRDAPGWHMIPANHILAKRLWNWYHAATETVSLDSGNVLRIGKMANGGPRLVTFRAQ